MIIIQYSPYGLRASIIICDAGSKPHASIRCMSYSNHAITIAMWFKLVISAVVAEGCDKNKSASVLCMKEFG